MASAHSGLLKEVQPSAELAAIVGSTPLPRTEIPNGSGPILKSTVCRMPRTGV